MEDVVMLSVVQLSDVTSQPKLMMDLPQLKVGDPIQLSFRIERNNGGRLEELSVNGKFKVSTVGYERPNAAPLRQLLSVDTLGQPPTWVSIKNRIQGGLRLKPAKSGPTPIF